MAEGLYMGVGPSKGYHHNSQKNNMLILGHIYSWQIYQNSFKYGKWQCINTEFDSESIMIADIVGLFTKEKNNDPS